MPIYVKKLDWAKCVGVPTRVHDSVAEEVLNYLFNTTAWKHNPDLLPRLVPKWRARLFTGEVAPDFPPATPVALVGGAIDGETPEDPPSDTPPMVGGDEDGPPHWSEVAVQLRAEGKSWSQVAEATGQKLSTVRDAVKRAQRTAAA